jgi:hypothetical protein
MIQVMFMDSTEDLAYQLGYENIVSKPDSKTEKPVLNEGVSQWFKSGAAQLTILLTRHTCTPCSLPGAGAHAAMDAAVGSSDWR